MHRFILSLFAVSILSGCPGDPRPIECDSSRDCSSAGLVCDTSQRECVECIADADCLTDGQVCLSRQCRTVTACESSRQCPGQVCDPARGYCVDCIGDVDCEGEMICRDAQCVEPPPPCESDRDCSNLALVCDVAAAICVECVGDVDCPSGLHCTADRTCRALECTPGATQCTTAGAIRTCRDDGTWAPAVACEAGQSCVGTTCTSTQCTPGCTGDEVCTDGSCRCGVESRCAAGTVCVGSSCIPTSCSPACALGETCVGTTCRCGDGPACTEGTVCNGTSCVAPACVPACGSGESCLGGSCFCGAGPRCESGQTCAGDRCVAITCEPACVGDEVCTDGACRCGAGPACAGDQTCVGTSCTSACPESPCRLVSPQCGCTSSSCDVDRQAGTRICRALGTRTEGQACSTDNRCVAGQTCVGYGDPVSLCNRFCETHTDCTGGEGSRCSFTINSEGGQMLARVCSVACDPRTGAGCPSDMACRISATEAGETVTDCRQTGTPFPLGCFGDAMCPVGEACKTTGIGGSCESYCRVGANDCGLMQVCDPLPNNPTLGGFVYGTCSMVTP